MALARPNSARSFETSSSISYWLNPGESARCLADETTVVRGSYEMAER
jgi:hypothetical protein